VKYTQSCFVEGKYYGEGIFIARRIRMEPISHVFICETCGREYARCPVTTSEGKTRPWYPLRGICRRCPPTWWASVPGSIWSGFDTDFSAALPDAWMKEELLLTIDSLKYEVIEND
jgi:hypothetical protein